jgi:hypothetical protein
VALGLRFLVPVITDSGAGVVITDTERAGIGSNIGARIAAVLIGCCGGFRYAQRVTTSLPVVIMVAVMMAIDAQRMSMNTMAGNAGFFMVVLPLYEGCMVFVIVPI